ncbi:MAG: carboxypeptidase-like regulatory domain-containing protein, partial [Cyclobacteriaceae bacterium]|nr:carboxypeptidase-like regulatory domain-containing protein [Cyclobacteriaceae bacterium]
MYRTLLLFIFALSSLELFSQDNEIFISGKVADTKGDAIPGVNIFIKNTSTGTISEFDGNYQLAIPTDAQFIVFSYIGFITIEEPINNRNIID